MEPFENPRMFATVGSLLINLIACALDKKPPKFSNMKIRIIVAGSYLPLWVRSNALTAGEPSMLVKYSDTLSLLIDGVVFARAKFMDASIGAESAITPPPFINPSLLRRFVSS